MGDPFVHYGGCKDINKAQILFFLLTGNKREYINSALKGAQQSTHNLYNMCQKAKQGKKKQKTTSLSELPSTNNLQSLSQTLIDGLCKA